MMIFSLVAMIALEKGCITSACLQWLCHSGERTVARGPLVFIYVGDIICPYQFLDIVGLNRLFIYFQYGGTLTSQTKHISSDYFNFVIHYRYCTKTTQVFFGHVFFSVTETDETIKIYKEYSKMD